MVIKINGEVLSYSLETEKNVGELLGSIEAACRKAQETIVTVSADGKELGAEKLDDLFAQPVDADIIIELSTVSGADIRSYMRSLAQELLATAAALEQIPVYMQTGKDTQVLALLESLSQKLNEFYRALLLSDITGLPADISIEGKLLAEYQKEITAFLQDIVTGIEEKDIILVGDLAEYELAPLVKALINGVLSFLI
ncbi:MAG: hypothetical protein ACTTI6_04590 [Treponema sp.]|uniref:hypothetical protein n=1 Tax=Treponema sp. TaxID=166 RepID=UPI003FA2F809